LAAAPKMSNSNLGQRGVALLAVLWLVAALSLIITGIVQSVRSEVRVVNSHRQNALASPLADAAILLALQSMHANKLETPKGMTKIPVAFGGQTFDVWVRPANGLLDINQAPLELIASLYQFAGDLDANLAQKLAQSTVEFRQTKNAKGASIGFDAPEDLLSVPEMSYNLYAKIKYLVTADLRGGSGRINPMASPLGILNVLTGGDAARAQALLAQRDANSALMDTSFFNPSQIEIAPSPNLQFQVRVPLADANFHQKTINIYWGTDPSSELPWRILSSQQAVVQDALNFN
jgi:general secretion pathway protein K